MGERKVKGEKVRNIGKGKGDGGLKGRAEQDGGERGEQKEGKVEVSYVTTVLTVRCLSSRRCLLIYWRDSFRRRVAF